MASYKNRYQNSEQDYNDVINADETSHENAKKLISKFSSVKVKGKMSKSKFRAFSASEQPSKRGGSQSQPSSPSNEIENDSVFINTNHNHLKSQSITQSAPNSPQTQRKLGNSQKTTNKLRHKQLARANSLSDIYSKADFDPPNSNLTRIRKLSVGSVEVLRQASFVDTEAERERKFVAKYSNAKQVIERKDTSTRTTTVITRNRRFSTPNQTILTSNVQKKIVTESSIQQTNTTATKSAVKEINTKASRKNSDSVDDQHVIKYRNRPIILQRKRSLGSIEVARQQEMNLKNVPLPNKEKVPPANRRLYRSSSVGAIRHALINAGQEQLPNKSNITTTITISPKNKSEKFESNHPVPASNNVKSRPEKGKISTNHAVSEVIKPTNAAKNESNPNFNTPISKASVAPVATNPVNGHITDGKMLPSKKYSSHDNGYSGANKGITTTVKLNGKVVATKVTNDTSHSVRSTAIANGFASSKNGAVSKATANSAKAKLSHAGMAPMANGNRYNPSVVANKH